MNEFKRQLDVKMGDTEGRAQNVMSKIEKNKRLRRPSKKPRMPLLATFTVVALACFLLFLLYPQKGPNQTADDPAIEEEVLLANYFSKLEETMYFVGEGNEFASYQLTTTWLSENYVQHVIDNGGSIGQQIYRITNNEIQLIYNKPIELEPVSFNLDELDKLKTISIMLKTPFETGDGFERKIMQSPTEVKVPFGTFEDAILVTEQNETGTTKYYYVEQYGLVKSEFITEDGYAITSSLASIGEPPSKDISTSLSEQEQIARYLETWDETYLVGVSPEMILKTYVFKINADGSKSPEVKALAVEEFNITWPYDLAYHQEKFDEMLHNVFANIDGGKARMHIKVWDIPFITVEFEKINDVWKITKIQ